MKFKIRCWGHGSAMSLCSQDSDYHLNKDPTRFATTTCLLIVLFHLPFGKVSEPQLLGFLIVWIKMGCHRFVMHQLCGGCLACFPVRGRHSGAVQLHIILIVRRDSGSDCGLRVLLQMWNMSFLNSFSVFFRLKRTLGWTSTGDISAPLTLTMYLYESPHNIQL